MTVTKRRVTPVRRTEPRTVPISREDYQQAVTALAAMIQQWWQYNERCAEQSSALSPEPTQPDPGNTRLRRLRRYVAARPQQSHLDPELLECGSDSAT